MSQLPRPPLTDRRKTPYKYTDRRDPPFNYTRKYAVGLSGDRRVSPSEVRNPDGSK